MRNSTFPCPVKMEYGWNITILDLKMMVQSGLEKIFLKFLHAGDYFLLLHKSDQNHKFSNKNDMVSAWRNFKNIFSRPLFTIIFRPKMIKFHPYSILTGEGKVDYLIYCMLSDQTSIFQCILRAYLGIYDQSFLLA